MVRWETENIILINDVTNNAQYFRHLYLLYFILIFFEGLKNNSSAFPSHAHIKLKQRKLVVLGSALMRSFLWLLHYEIKENNV
jgi:hypothetical protein